MMSKFNSRIQISYQSQLDEVDDFGNPLDAWVIRLANLPAIREVVKGSLKDIANREQNILYYKWTIWAGSSTRAILSTDRLTDLTNADRIHEITTVYESDNGREITILTRSADNQSVYDAS